MAYYPLEQISMRFEIESRYNNFTQENDFENVVYKMAAILSYSQCANFLQYQDLTSFQ